MNERDREALGVLVVSARPDELVTDARTHLEARLNYTDKLERALAWASLWASDDGESWETVLHFPGPKISEAHDGTCPSVAAALIRLHLRVTGGE